MNYLYNEKNFELEVAPSLYMHCDNIQTFEALTSYIVLFG